MEKSKAPDAGAHPTCKICDRGSLRHRAIYRLSGPAVAIGYILLIPAILGIAFSALVFIGAMLFSLKSGMAAGLAGGSAIVLGVGSLVGGLFGWLLVMKKWVLQCDNCGAVVNASAASNSRRTFGLLSLLAIAIIALLCLFIREHGLPSPVATPTSAEPAQAAPNTPDAEAAQSIPNAEPAEPAPDSTSAEQSQPVLDDPAATMTHPSLPSSTVAPVMPAMGTSTLLVLTGSGSKSTHVLTVPKEWSLEWSYDCSNFMASGGNFQVFIYNSDGSPAEVNGLNQLGSRGGDTEYYHQGGSLYFVINSECRWTIKVLGKST
jgi:hypothetical protein